MKMYNETKKLSLPFEIEIFNKFFSRLKGMMLMKKAEAENKAFLISPCNSIHTFFMNFPIEAVFMKKKDNEFEVIKMYKNILPRRIIPFVPGSNCVLEFFLKNISDKYFAPGDKIRLE